MHADRPDRTTAYEAVEALADWSEWTPFNDAVASAPRTPGVYLFRLSETREIVYVGMAGPRIGGGKAKGLRGRLSIYQRGRGAVSGFGEAALDQALGDEAWVNQQLDSLRQDGPKRAKVWAQEAIAWLASEVRWTECADKNEASVLEKRIEGLLRAYDLWNRAAQKARTTAAPGPGDEPATATAYAASDTRPVPANDPVTFEMHGYNVDLDLLYREMYRYSALVDGERVFRGGAKDTRAIKWLLADLFDVPAAATKHPVNHAIRNECRDRLDALGWATKGPGRSPRYTLHRDL